MGFNFVVIFAPGTLEDAPHSFMATISMPPDEEPAFSRAVATAFPSVSVIRLTAVVDTVAGILGQLADAVRAAASVATFACTAILICPPPALTRDRPNDTSILLLFGAT